MSWYAAWMVLATAIVLAAFVAAFIFIKGPVFLAILLFYLPLVGILGAALVQFVPAIAEWIGKPEATQLIYVIIGATLFTLILSMILCFTCQIPHPAEAFQDVSSNTPTVDQLQSSVTDAEEAVCKFITRADQYIKSDVGPAGDKNPTLVSEARQKARTNIDLVLCSDGAPVANNSDSNNDLTALENRIARLESTLSGFTGVVFKKSYDETVPCKESFVAVAASPADELARRLTAIQQTIQDQQTKYLDPMDQKTKDLRAGKASDCDKRRGAMTVVKGGRSKDTGGQTAQ